MSSDVSPSTGGSFITPTWVSIFILAGCTFVDIAVISLVRGRQLHVSRRSRDSRERKGERGDEKRKLGAFWRSAWWWVVGSALRVRDKGPGSDLDHDGGEDRLEDAQRQLRARYGETDFISTDRRPGRHVCDGQGQGARSRLQRSCEDCNNTASSSPA